MKSFPPPPKIRIGLALGSGVARGWAHIGVIRKLVQSGFAPDIVVGTSIGAVVGGAYVANYLNEIEVFARSLTTRRIFGMLDLSFNGSGIFSGRKISDELYKHMSNIKMENMPKKFIAVATELATGHEIWLQQGSLVDSVRASYALPGVFSPVLVDGRWLIDGALVNPVPSSVCRAFGARLVIAVNLNRDAFGKSSTTKSIISISAKDFENIENTKNIENDVIDPSKTNKMNPFAYRSMIKKLFNTNAKKPSVTTVLLSSLNIMQDRLARSRLAGDPPDIHIAPHVGHIGLLDFNRSEEAITLGEMAAEAMLPEIKEAAEVLL